MVNCLRCGSDRLFQFEASRARSDVPGRPAVPPAELPVVCRHCGHIMIGGKSVPLPDPLEIQAKTMAEQAHQVAEETRQQLLKNPDGRIEGYFQNVYRRAFLDGFWRAIAFTRHNTKIGRVKRLRELWGAFGQIETRRDAGGMVVHLFVPLKEYTEFKELLHLGLNDASSSTD